MSDPTGTSKLKWKIFVPPAVATVNDDLPPGETARMWSPTSSILIHGEQDAILVDTPVTNAQATALADWVEETGKNITTIYSAHGHGDHFFGNGILLKRFLELRPLLRGRALPNRPLRKALRQVNNSVFEIPCRPPPPRRHLDQPGSHRQSQASSRGSSAVGDPSR